VQGAADRGFPGAAQPRNPHYQSLACASRWEQATAGPGALQRIRLRNDAAGQSVIGNGMNHNEAAGSFVDRVGIAENCLVSFNFHFANFVEVQ
jgi:hypothetical protein